MEILGTGLSGLVGTRVMELLPEFTFQNLSLETGFDITDREAVFGVFSQAPQTTILHMAAYTDVDKAEKQKPDGENSLAWKVNVLATKYLTEACQTYHKRLIYISTDFVFDGTKNEYHEQDTPNPISWYGQTKYEGEKIVRTHADSVIVRISYPYRAAWSGKPDFVHRIVARLHSNQPLFGVTDQIFVPTCIDDIARVLKFVCHNKVSGVVHSVGSEALSPMDALRKIAKNYGFSAEIITPTTADKYYQGQAKRPLHAVLKNDTMARSGISLLSFQDGLKKIIKQEKESLLL